MPEIIPFSFLHCADLHLDSPFEGLQAVAPSIAAVLREATFRAFERIIALALAEKVDFILIAGDVYDGETRSLKAQLRFRDGLRRASDAGIQIFIAHGNHDPLSGWEAALALPEHARRFAGDQVQRLVAARDGQVLAHIYGISFPVREVKANLATGFRREAGAPFAIGLLHANVGGDPDYDNYAPCTLADLGQAGFNYWALGHIHSRRLLKPQAPCILYPGNPQGRSRRELGEKGCYLVRVDATGTVTPEFVATDVVRWFVREINIAALSTWDTLLDELTAAKEEVRTTASGRAAILRLILTGRGELHRELLRRIDCESDLAAPLREGEAEREDFVWTEAVIGRTRPVLDLASRLGVQDFVGDFLNAAAQLREGDDPGLALREVLRRRPEQRLIASLVDHWQDDDLLVALSEAETLGLDRLLPEDE